jgi:hypothetical protein
LTLSISTLMLHYLNHPQALSPPPMMIRCLLLSSP